MFRALGFAAASMGHGDAKADDREDSAEALERGSPVAAGGAAAPQDQGGPPHEGDASRSYCCRLLSIYWGLFLRLPT